jgi:hypothetical protein
LYSPISCWFPFLQRHGVEIARLQSAERGSGP